MDNFTHRLLSAETDFLAALKNGTQMLACSQAWSTLLEDVSTGLLTGSIPGETLSLAHSVASRVSYIARWYLDVELGVDKISAQFHEDCDTMLRRMNALCLNDNVEPTSLRDGHSGKVHSTASAKVETPSHSFIPSAHEWLLDNLHNPYPTSEVKAQLATSSSCQVSSVNSWFINARRRIGWTTLCREKFSNCRADMIDAAYRAFVEEDPRRTLSLELRHSFVAMKVAAENIYPSSFVRDIFAGGDPVVRDTMDEHKDFIEVGDSCPVEQGNLGKAAEDSYPSPARSFVESPMPAIHDSLTDETEEVAAPILVGSKRCRSFIEEEDQGSTAARRPIKRLRTSATSQAQLPSPSSSTDGNELPSDVSSPRATNGAGMPNYSNDSVAIPNLASDPLPSPNIGDESVNDWFNSDFDSLFALPPPVDTIEPDFSASWEVELFKDYCIPEHSEYASKCPQITETDVSAATQLSDFDSLLLCLASQSHVIPSDSILSSNTIVDPHTAFLDPSIPDVSHIDWTSLLDGSNTYQSIDSSFFEYPAASQSLTDIDLSMLQLPALMPTAQSHPDLASQRAKLDQLHAMQEAVRRMEQELQSEGVMF